MKGCFFTRGSFVRSVRPKIVLPSLIVILCCSEWVGELMPIWGLLCIQRRQNVKTFKNKFTILNLIRRFPCSDTKWKAVIINSLLVLVPGKWLPRVCPMHAAVKIIYNKTVILCTVLKLSEIYAFRQVRLSYSIKSHSQVMCWAFRLLRVFINGLPILWFQWKGEL